MVPLRASPVVVPKPRRIERLGDVFASCRFWGMSLPSRIPQNVAPNSFSFFLQFLFSQIVSSNSFHLPQKSQIKHQSLYQINGELQFGSLDLQPFQFPNLDFKNNLKISWDRAVLAGFEHELVCCDSSTSSSVGETLQIGRAHV